MLTLQQIIQDVYDKLSVDTDSTTYSTWGRVVPKINSVMHKILSDRKYDVLIQDSTYHPYIKGGDIQFLRGVALFDKPRTLVANRVANEWEDEIYFTKPQNIKPTWYCLIKWMIFKYTYHADIISETYWISLDEPLQIKIRPGDEVEILYEVPDNAEETYQLFSLAQNREIELTYADYRYPNDFLQYWTILSKGWKKLIRVVAPDAWYLHTFKLNYYNKVTNLTSPTDKTVFPDERRDRDVLSLLVAGELLRETEKSDDATVKLNEWYWNLVLFYDKFATTNKWFRQDLWWNRGLQHNVAII